jgi:excisionase family DNA binding protein
MIQRNQIPHLKMGKSVRIRESDLVAWLEEQIVPKHEPFYH